MSLFHKLQDVYFDAVALRTELDRIPPQGNGRDADAHLNGQSCETNTPPDVAESEAAWRKRCLDQVKKLREGIYWLQDDVQRGRRQLRPGEADGELERQLFLIETFIGSVGSTLDRMEDQLAEFRAAGADMVLQQMKGRAADLQRYITGLNKIL